MSITAEEFYTQREFLIQEQQDNQGKRGYGVAATEKKIAEVLGFTDDNNTGYWGFPESYFECPIDKPYVRQSFIQAAICPAGLWSPTIDIKYGKTWEPGKKFNFSTDSRFSYPRTSAKNILSTAYDVVVFDSEEEAYSAAINQAEAWLEDEGRKMTELMEQFAYGELSEECPLDIYAITDAICAIDELVEWLDGIAATVGNKKLPQDPDGQLRLAGEDLMPTEEGVLAEDKSHMAVAEKYRSSISHLLSAQMELKEIKDEALAPHKEEIDAKKASIELWTFIANYYQIVSAMEEARIKSKKEDPAFCVYAYTISGVKGVRVEVGTKQDIRDKEFEISASHTLEIIAEFLHGEIVSDEADVAVSATEAETEIPETCEERSWTCPPETRTLGSPIIKAYSAAAALLSLPCENCCVFHCCSGPFVVDEEAISQHDQPLSVDEEGVQETAGAN